MIRVRSLVVPVLALAAAVGAGAQTIRTGPSAYCHVTDGTFTNCPPPPPGGKEWSDVDFLPFLGANVYSDQRLSPARLHLMYDLPLHHTPLGPAESFDVRFDVVEDGELEHYLVRCFGNGTMQVFEDGEPIPAGGTSCATGFGPSPTSGFLDVLVELDVPMNVVYSPDIPLFWSTAAPQSHCRPGTPGCCKPEEPGCCGPEGCQGKENVPTSATIVSANSDGTTTVAKVPLEATTADFCTPGGGGILGGLLDALVPPEGGHDNHGDFVRQVTAKTKEALESLVFSGVLTRNEAGKVLSCIVNARAQSDSGKK